MFDKVIKNRLFKILDKIHYGQITIDTPEGETLQFLGDRPGYQTTISLKDWRVVANLIIKGDVGFAEDYRDGYFTTDSLLNIIRFGLQNDSLFDSYAGGKYWFRAASKLLYFTKRNSLKGSRRNIRAHYDLGNEFYQLWLDKTMTYSSGLFTASNQDITVAQLNKYDRLLSKIGENPCQILEVGCGWGGFADRAAAYNHQVKGITLSKEQAKYAVARLNGKAEIAIEDYRKQSGSYDYIVSIEMFEAVGYKYWPEYFAKLKQLLKPGGKILLQTITIQDDLFERYKKSADMIRTFIFPGGMLPSENLLERQLAKNALVCKETFRFGNDYAKTLMIWLNNFFNKIEQVKQLGFNDGFIRMWEFYLCACIAAFEAGRINVVQMEIAHLEDS